MADFNITVDTTEMASSLAGVNSNVRNVTSSVVAMQGAVVLAQQQASQEICRNVDAGFYILMKSQFDQKLAAVSSEMMSRMQLMESLKEQLDKIMLIMQDDYERIKLRYQKAFSSIDSALETRIHELDKRAYEISRNYRRSKFSNGSEVVKALLYGDETQLLNVKEISASVKKKSAASINVMADDVIEQLHYSGSVESILGESNINSNEDEYAPVIFSETDSMISSDSTVKNIHTPSSVFADDSRFLNSLKESEEKLSWKKDESQYKTVKNSFEEMVSAEVKDGRVAEEMLRLFKESEWEETVL